MLEPKESANRSTREAKKKAEVRPFSLPGSYLVLELANGCNLRCRHCAQSDPSHPHTHETGYFPQAGVEALLTDLRENGIRFSNLVLFWLGEPLLHPKFVNIYSMLQRSVGSESSFDRLELHTNATLLNERLAAGILNRSTGPQRWHLTLDAHSPSTYHAIKGLKLFERARDNIARLITYKGRGGFPWPQLVVQFIVGSRNELEVPPFIEHWSAAFERARLPWRLCALHVPEDTRNNYIFLKSLDCPTAEEQARENQIYARVIQKLGLESKGEDGQRLDAPSESLARQLATPCSGFWKSPVIGWDGMLTTCTRDSLGENSLGNVLEQPFSKLWFGGGTISSWRRRVARGDYSHLSLCQDCFIPKSLNYTSISPAELECIGETLG